MSELEDRFDWTVADAAVELGVVGDGTMYHATRERHVETILRDGLRTDPEANGILNPYPTERRHHWVDAFYGMRPVFLLTGPTVHETYYWEHGEDGKRETPIVLEVDVTGLRLLPDICTFENPVYVPLVPEGIGWSIEDLQRDECLKPLPELLRPYSQDGIVPYSVLMTDAAAAAIAATGTVAVLENIPPSRISRL
jgi:hypothetical protein